MATLRKAAYQQYIARLCVRCNYGTAIGGDLCNACEQRMIGIARLALLPVQTARKKLRRALLDLNTTHVTLHSASGIRSGCWNLKATRSDDRVQDLRNRVDACLMAMPTTARTRAHYSACWDACQTVGSLLRGIAAHTVTSVAVAAIDAVQRPYVVPVAAPEGTLLPQDRPYLTKRGTAHTGHTTGSAIVIWCIACARLDRDERPDGCGQCADLIIADDAKREKRRIATRDARKARKVTVLPGRVIADYNVQGPVAAGCTCNVEGMYGAACPLHRPL